MRHPGLVYRVRPKAATEPYDVRIERHDQLRRRHAVPHAEIDFVAAQPSSAGTGSAVCTRCPAMDVERNNTRRGVLATTVGAANVQCERARRKAVEGGTDILVVGFIPSRKNCSMRSRPLEHLPKDPEERNQVVAADPPVHHRRASPAEPLPGSKRRTNAAGVGPSDGEQRCRWN